MRFDVSLGTLLSLVRPYLALSFFFGGMVPRSNPSPAACFLSRLNPACWHIFRYARFLGEQRGDRKGAIRMLKRALHLEPDNAATGALLEAM